MNAPPLADGMYWRDDVGRLITTIKSILPSLDPTPVRRGWRSGYRRGVLAAILLALLAAGASVGLGQGNESPADVDIGAIYPLTGIDASSGRDVYNGVRFAVQYVNEGGIPDLNLPLDPGAGLPGLDGAKIRLRVVDSRGERCTAESLFTGLAKGGVAAVIGAYQSTVTLQAIYAADNLHVPLVNESSTAPSFTANDNRNGIRRTACGKSEDDRTPSPWFFRVGPDESQSADQFEQFLLAERRRGFTVNRIAILHEDSDIYGDSVSAVTKRLARRLGLRDADIKDVGYPTVLGQPAVPPNSPCTASERKLNAKLEKGIAAIQDFEPDVLFLGGYKADAVATLQTMGKLDYEPPKVLAYGAGYEDKHYYRDVMRGRKECDLAPANPYGVITRVSWSLQLRAQRDTATKAAAAFKQRYGTAMNGKSARGFTGMIALALAIDKAGSTDAAKIQAALQQMDVRAANTIMPWAGIRFNGSGQNVQAQVVLEQQTKRGNVVVFPPEYLTGAAVSFRRARRAA